jgi:hypothetical protein
LVSLAIRKFVVVNFLFHSFRRCSTPHSCKHITCFLLNHSFHLNFAD